MYVCIYVCMNLRAYACMYSNILIFTCMYFTYIYIYVFSGLFTASGENQSTVSAAIWQFLAIFSSSASLGFSKIRFVSSVSRVQDPVNAMPPHGWTKLSSHEMQQAKQWYDNGDSCTEIAEKLGRDRSVITRLLVKQVPRLQQGRPAALTKGNIAFMKRKLAQLVKTADCRYTVTVAMLKKACNFKVSERCITTALHNEGIYFRKLREKPVLTAADIAARLAFARKYHLKPKSWWNKSLHAAIDGKFFKACLNDAARTRAAQRATFGAYRGKGEGLDAGYVKPKGALNYNTGARSLLILAGVGNGRMLMWHQVPNSRWNGKAAASMYQTSLLPALKAAYPGRKRFQILEDNDPTGFKSKKGIAAKRTARLDVLEIPRRSPDLCVLDYAIWSEINRRMRRQEQKWAKGKRETRAQFAARLRRTAMRLPKDFIAASVSDMKRRCERILEAKGGLIEEGGK